MGNIVAKWRYVFASCMALFPPVRTNSGEVPAGQLIDDAASSICIDEQDYFEVQHAIEVLRENRNNVHQQTDFDRYNQMVAQKMVQKEQRNFGANEPITLSLHSNESATIDIENSSLQPNYQTHLYQLKAENYELLMLAGSTGVGLMSDLQFAIMLCGPVGLLLGYVFAAVLYALAYTPIFEMMAFHPLQGGFSAYVSTYWNKSIGRATGIGYWISCACSAPCELVSAVSLFSIYPKLNTVDNGNAVWMIYFCVIMCSFVFLPLKHQYRIATLYSFVLTIAIALCLAFMFALNDGTVPPDHTRIGFKYWRNNGETGDNRTGPFQDMIGWGIKVRGSSGNFLQVLAGMIFGLKSLASTDKILVMVPHLRNPRKAIRHSVKYFYARLILFIILPALSVGINVMMNDPLLTTGLNKFDFTSGDLEGNRFQCGIRASNWENYDGSQAICPWFIALTRAHLCQAIFAINAFILLLGLLSVWLRLNAAIQTLFGLGVDRCIPRAFARHTNRGVAYVSAIVSLCVFLLFYYLSFGNDTLGVFIFLTVLDISMLWIVTAILCYTTIRFYKAVDLRTDRSVDRFDDDWPYRAPFHKWGAAIAIFFMLISAIVGYPLVQRCLKVRWTGLYFGSMSFAVAILVVVGGSHWLRYRTRIVSLYDLNMLAAKQALDNHEWVEDRVLNRGILANCTQFLRHIRAMLTQVYHSSLFDDTAKKKEV